MPEYMSFPSTVKELAGEIVRVADDYSARKISNATVQEVIGGYAHNCPELLFNADALNPTVAKIIGKKRCRLVETIVNAAQRSSV